MREDHKYTNALIESTSPYLLQHAHNPVHWMPWSSSALSQAKEEEKLMIISIGYSACHWCHVMEHESFEDEIVAEVMNKHFVSIKVDREERPDIDQVYMDAAYVVTGTGGWPLNAITLPDGRPIYAGTYFPKEKWLGQLEFFQKIWESEPQKLLDQATAIANRASAFDSIPDASKHEFSEADLHKAIDNYLPSMDMNWGGRRGSPKFPMPNNLLFMLEYYRSYSREEVWSTLELTLDRMAAGGIYDHVGGGFARYSVDSEWHVPHFEKMLYDNGQLISLYSDAYSLSSKQRYADVVIESIDFAKTYWLNADGGFYSAFDADSEGEEGTFYVWTKDEIQSVLGAYAAIFIDLYDIKDGNGNWEKGLNVLRRINSIQTIADRHDLGIIEVQRMQKTALNKLKEVRANREWPGLDDKSLLSWNALMLKGLCKAYRALGNESYLSMATNNADYILKCHVQEDGSVFRSYKEGQSTINGFLDDYALTIEAFLELYQITFDQQYLLKAESMADYVLKHFYDDQSGLFYYTSDKDAKLIQRKRELTDNVIPGSNSTMFKSLYLLGTLLDSEDYKGKSKRAALTMKDGAIESPHFYSNWLMLGQLIVNPPLEVAVLGENAIELTAQLQGNNLHNVLYLGGKSAGNLKLLNHKLVEGQTMIYVCKNKTCKAPVNNVEAAIELIKSYD